MPEPGDDRCVDAVNAESEASSKLDELVDEFVIRPLIDRDEAAFLRACDEFSESDFVFGLGYETGMLWADYLKYLDDVSQGVNLSDSFVPATFRVAVVGDQIVGRVSIRHRLNDHLRRIGGHIGYAVVPQFRRRGIATAMLKHGIQHAKHVGVSTILVTCDESNIGSAVVIQTCGGGFRNSVALPSGVVIQYYEILATAENDGGLVPGHEAETVCPLCKRDNECQVECQARCWCGDVTVPAALSELVPQHLRPISCICRRCIIAYNANPDAFRKALNVDD